MKNYLEKLVTEALSELFGIGEVSFVIEHPKDMSHGDYATNAALVVAKHLANPPAGGPKEIAEQLVAYLNEHKGDTIDTISIAGPGFINFTLARDVFVKGLEDTQSKEWGSTDVYADKKILVEHSSPNLFKPFHIGHLMNNTIGESITRLAKSSGAQVSTMSFPSDISLGVAKAIFILLEKYGADFVPTDVAVLGDAYVEGTKRYEDDPSIQVRVKEIADNLYAGKSSPELTLFNACKKINIDYFEKIVAGLGSHFDSYIYESEAGIDGTRIVKENTPKVFTESEGAIVYIPEESRKDINTAVFINSQGNPTYEAKDIGLLDLKFKTYNPDLSIFITDAQQVSHFQVVLDAAAKINSTWADKSLHRFHGRMSFKGQKMSSRLGGVPLVEEVLATVIDEVKEKNPDVTTEVAEVIGIAAIKFAILRTAAGKDINFDPDTSLSFEGDSGPYLQYTAVRAGSLIEKGKAQGIAPDTTTPVSGTELLERLIARLPEVVATAQAEWAPHHLVGYLLELAQAFNSWYGQGKIIDENTTATAYRLAIVAATRQTLTNGLWMLGIEVPERM
ncbi:MAG: arginine--tRNA ligase [Candidatus Pacebacteria bacterium]|jgi:arginyl-tRNA synthetase|nr:arginine--tRNA ligase [Candidatus Paceibacterota bacterium]MBP9701137.1 arginine--tRNA ligase [Candidatus Paceibacterota bacterium]